MQEKNREQIEATIDGTATAGNAENSIGQFKSPEALYKSYNELQREYTKKCQALKSSDKRMPRMAQEILDELTEKFPKLNAYKDAIKAADIGELTESLARLVTEFNGDGIKEMTEKIYEAAYNDGDIRKKIFEEMIEDYAGVSLPKHAKNRGQIPITPSQKPKNLNEAANMARKIIKTRSVN